MKRLVLSLLVLLSSGVAFGKQATSIKTKSEIEKLQKEIDALTTKYQSTIEDAQRFPHDEKKQHQAIADANEIKNLQAKIAALKQKRK